MNLATAYDLTPDHVAAYARDGFVVLPQLATREEVAAYRPAILETAERHMQNLKPLGERDTYGKAFLQIWHLCEQDARVAQFVLARRFARVAAALLQTDVVRLYHDQVLFKEPGGGYTPWHQDQFYIPLDTTQVLTMWMPLVDVAAAMGTMSFATGSHHEGQQLDMGTSDDSEVRYGELIDARGWPVHACGAMAAGDASFHTGWTIHCAGGNDTDRMREAITILYYADGARLLAEPTPIQPTASKFHLGGRGAGELADSDMNPVVYRRYEDG